MLRTIRAAHFLIKGPLVLLLLLLINWMINMITGMHIWWVQWAALGIGIAWLVSLFRVLKGVALAGGIAALLALLRKRDY